jgi:hypothetical protein
MLHMSLFSQMLGIIARKKFEKHVTALQTDRHSKGFTSWEHFVSMLFCQLAQAKSLREIVNGLKSCEGRLNHLGMFREPSRSNLSYCNASRTHELFKAVFDDLLDKCVREYPKTKRKFKFTNKLYSLDATVIDLCLSMYDWAKFRSTKGAVKIHLLLDHDGYLPSFVHITEGIVHESQISRMVPLQPDSIVAMDKGYVDYALFHEWTLKRVWFVTRLKDNAAYEAVESRPCSGNVLYDETIAFSTDSAKRKCPSRMRRIVVWNEDKQEPFELVTNHHGLDAETIGAIYKERWQIEIFFKTIKQNLKLKTFVGTSSNAVMIQIWTALIAILLVKYLNFKSSFNWSISNLVALLKMNLFTYRDLWTWIDNPYVRPDPPPDEQLCLAL